MDYKQACIKHVVHSLLNASVGNCRIYRSRLRYSEATRNWHMRACLLHSLIYTYMYKKHSCSMIISLTAAQNTPSLYAFIILGSDIYNSLFPAPSFVLRHSNEQTREKRERERERAYPYILSSFSLMPLNTVRADLHPRFYNYKDTSLLRELYLRYTRA